MEPTYVFKLLILIFAFKTNVNSYSSKFYEHSFEYEYDCSVQFDSPRNFDCACINGLWKLYGSECMELLTIGGDKQYCFSLPGIGITRAELLLEDKNHISIQRSDASISYFNDDSQSPIEIDPKDTLIVGMEWTLGDENGNEVCLAASEDSYCFFSGSNLGIGSKIATMKQGCDDGLVSVLPSSCKNINSENKNICSNRIVKRDVNQQGRVFFGAPGQNGTVPLSVHIYDEDYTGSNSSSNTSSSDAIASEIWNYMDTQLDQLLGLKEPKENKVDGGLKEEDDSKLTPSERKAADRKAKAERKAAAGRTAAKRPQTGRVTARGKRATSIKGNKKGRSMGSSKDSSPPSRNYTMTAKNYRSPVFQFLELTKDVMAKTCPSAYVNPEFFGLAVSTFINIQKKHFKFPETATSYHGYWRVVDSLTDCIANISMFNFTADKCASREKPVTGTYCAFGNCSHEMNVMAGFEDFEPMIETVWNLFKNTHSACFSYFNQNFNDHHRFTMWMMPLFQNQVNDIWKQGSAKGVVYGGIFGNQENVQTAIAYCTASSQMLSKYPWDLPRPNKIDELTRVGRRKREISETQCLSPESVSKCS